TYGTRLAERLSAAGISVHHFPFMNRPITEREKATPFHLLAGGAVPVHSKADGMVAALDALGVILMRTLEDASHTNRVIGTCLGMQMIAACLASPAIVIEPSTPINVGMEPVYGIAPGDPIPMAMFHYHRVDAAFADDPRLDAVFHTADNPMAGFRINNRIIAYQGHPELSPQDMGGLLAHNQTMIEAHGVTRATAQHQIDRGGDGWAVSFADQLLTAPFSESRPA
ncbi:MAG: hypothetical protein AAF213_01655, partial [Pseudomonadota bacterium]